MKSLGVCYPGSYPRVIFRFSKIPQHLQRAQRDIARDGGGNEQIKHCPDFSQAHHRRVKLSKTHLNKPGGNQKHSGLGCEKWAFLQIKGVGTWSGSFSKCSPGQGQKVSPYLSYSSTALASWTKKSSIPVPSTAETPTTCKRKPQPTVKNYVFR